MNFYSQAGQDRFVYELLVKSGIAPVGTFLDIGAGGLSISNTLGLEELGWIGWLIDNSTEAANDSRSRKSTFICDDATRMNYDFLPPRIDYLSLDVNGASLAALMQLPLKRVWFSVITIEHDAYRFGDSLRSPMRKILLDHDYALVHPDVSNPDPFEDWWTMRELAERAKAIIPNLK